jgi:hypothetical protein
MKLGVSYNLFDGEELLLYSIQAIRELVDYINVVYQIVSNQGNKASENLEEMLYVLLENKLIDELYYYYPNLNLHPNENETCKRNIGLHLAKYCNCTHFMNIDVDEFYDSEQFKFAKQYIEDNKIGCSAAGIVSYIKEPIYRIEGVRHAYVPFICEIDSSTEIKSNAVFPVTISPTRGFSGNKPFHLFDTKSLVMHHMELVRCDIEKKFSKSAEYLKQNTLNWEYGNTFRYSNNFPELEVSNVENIFGIDIHSQKWKQLNVVPMPKILLTNHYLMDYAGSEITTLEMALVLKEMGYDINVATFSLEDPIKSEFEKHNIRAFNILHESLPVKEYDIAWCHHASVLSYIVNSGVRIRKVIFRTLSPLHPLEALPYYVNDIDIVLATSSGTAERYYSDGWIEKDKIEVFPNSIPKIFFIKSRETQNKELKKIAIVSNHVPEELSQATDIIRNHSIEVDMLGLSNKYQLINPDILLPYDVVISIGKTIQYCFALGIPVFCYDHFGGPGYITKDNFEKAGYYTFSGRCCNRHLEASVLADEIISGYNEALNNLEQLKAIAKEKYDLKTNMKNILKRLEKIQTNDVFYNRKFSRDIKMGIVHNEFYVEVLKKAYSIDRYLFLPKQQDKEEESAGFETSRIYQDELNCIINSRSWRYTAPLRSIGRYVRRLFK